MLCLFRLEFEEPAVMRPEIAGRPVYLAMADGRAEAPASSSRRTCC